MAGYDQFFKEAQKATGLIKGDKPASKKASSERSSGRSTGKSSGSKNSQKNSAESVSDSVRDSVNFSRSRSILNRPTETPEQRLRAELANRIRDKRSTALRRKKKFPLYPVACTMAALLMCGTAFYFSDELDAFAEKAMSHVEIGVFGDAHAEGAAHEAKPNGKADAKADAKKAPAAKSVGDTKAVAAGEKPEAPAAAEGTPLKGWTTEEMAFFSKLNDRKKELDAREADLAKLDEELQKRKVELDEKLKQLEAMREDISKALKTRVTSDKEKVAKLVEFYSTMKPQQASKVIETLNEDLAVQILDSMKKKNAAEVLNVMDAKKARRLSELLTGYQRTPASATAPDESVPAAGEPATK